MSLHAWVFKDIHRFARKHGRWRHRKFFPACFMLLSTAALPPLQVISALSFSGRAIRHVLKPSTNFFTNSDLPNPFDMNSFSRNRLIQSAQTTLSFTLMFSIFFLSTNMIRIRASQLFPHSIYPVSQLNGWIFIRPWMLIAWTAMMTTNQPVILRPPPMVPPLYPPVLIPLILSSPQLRSLLPQPILHLYPMTILSSATFLLQVNVRP